MSYSYQSKRQDFAKHIRSEQKQNIFEKGKKKNVGSRKPSRFLNGQRAIRSIVIVIY